MSTGAPFTVSMDAVLANAKVTLEASGDFSVAGIKTVKVGDLIKALNSDSDTMTLTVQHPGYNTLYAETKNSRFVVVLTGTETAYIFVEIAPTGVKANEVCSLAGFMKKKTQ